MMQPLRSLVIVLACLAGCVPVASAIPSADRAAGVLVYPYISVDGAHERDTILQLSNAAADAHNVQCFLEDATRTCTNTGALCDSDADCESGDLCIGEWQVTDFTIRLTAGQPISWNASTGLAQLPCSTGGCPGGTSGGQIVPAPKDPFVGALRCVVESDQGDPITASVLEGVATVETIAPSEAVRLDVAEYSAIGFAALEVDGDRTLSLGTEYEGCPSLLSVTHMYDNAQPIPGTAVTTDLVLLPCSVDYRSFVPTSLFVQYLTINEFEQRLGTGKRLNAFQAVSLSRIHTRIFDVGVQGTLTGQTRISAVNNLSIDRANAGLIGLVIEHFGAASASYAVTTVGENGSGDEITLPQP